MYPISIQQVRGSVVTICIFLCFHSVFAQDASKNKKAPNGVSLVSLFPPLYPPISRSAHVTGDVVVELLIRKDGSVESARTISGNALLLQSALESAKNSKFECGGCQRESVPYTLTYTYQISGNPCSCAAGVDHAIHPPTISQSANHIIISAQQLCVDPSSCGGDEEQSKYRSLKCFYLWKCGNHHYAVM